jgi:FtsP/CotA-like multicopper oxidase with cupredoxin domain
MSRTLNLHLQATPQLQTKPCDQFSLDDVQQIQMLVHGVRDPGLDELYSASGDPRLLMESDDAKLKSVFAQELLLADKDTSGTVHGILRDARCHTVVMLYVHHLPSSTRDELHQHAVLPLLPARAHQPRRALQHVSGLDSNATQFVASQYGDALNCAKCHLSPNATIDPMQNHYESPVHPLLVNPPVRSSVGGFLNVTLHVNVTRTRGPVQYNTRAYNGLPVGPTLRVRAGDVVRVTLANDLEAQPSAPSASNFYRLPNSTNLHMHGLWAAPQDVFSSVDPGARRTYEFVIPAEHSPGTLWYHPHFHGSVALQLANGMAGVMVVEASGDDSGSLPPMAESILVFQQVAVYNYEQLDIACSEQVPGLSRCHDLDGAGSLLTMARLSGDLLPLDVDVSDPNAGSLGPAGGNNYFTVNGDFQPALTAAPGEWLRWRLLNAAHQSSLSVSVPGCRVLLLAMDGVFLRSGTPRVRGDSAERPVVLPPGSRADLAISCKSEGKYLVQSTENPDLINLGQQTGFYSGILAVLQVSGPAAPPVPEPTRLPALPSYLADLAPPPASASPVFARWDIVDVINNTDGKADVPIYGVTGRPFDSTTMRTVYPNETVDVVVQNPIWLCNASQPKCAEVASRAQAHSEIYERAVTLSHGFHLHTYKFQVVSDSTGGSFSADYDLGDWRDTIFTPVAANVTVRFRVSHPTEGQPWSGLLPLHCHMSVHSDRGMLALLEVANSASSEDTANSSRGTDSGHAGGTRKLLAAPELKPASAAPPPAPTPPKQCNGHGLVYAEEAGLGEPLECECFQCYTGDQCQTVAADCLIGGPAEATMTMEWWQRHEAELRVNISATYHMGYLLTPRVLPSGIVKGDSRFDKVSRLLNKAIRDLHTTVGNAKTDGYNVVLGAGGVQILDSLMWSFTQLKRNANRSMAVFARPPYYPHYRQASNLNPLTAFNASLEQRASDVIEIVTVPNNPDSRASPPVFADSPNIVRDYVYDWPSTSPTGTNVTMRTDDVMVYSMAKLAGYSSSRIGWALVKDPELASMMSHYIFLQSTAAACESQLRATKVLRAIQGSLGGPDDYFTFFRTKLADRWHRLARVFDAQQGPADQRYSLDCVRSSIFAWIRCGSAINGTCTSTFAPVGIYADNGADYGANASFVRVVIGYHDSTFELQLARFEALLLGNSKQ